MEKKICERCGKEFETPRTKQRFCSRSCAQRGKKVSEETRKKLSKITTYNLKNNEELRRNMRDKVWSNTQHQKKSSERMKKNNPMKNDVAREKMISTLKQNQRNCFNNCGNGHISYVESLLMDDMIKLGFVYNLPINTRAARERFPEKRYAYSYKPDFVHLELKLCVEIDGTNHTSHKEIERDKKKEDCLNFLGYRTIRFTNEQVIDEYEYVLNCIREELRIWGD